MLTIMVCEKIHRPHSISELLLDNYSRELKKNATGCLIEHVSNICRCKFNITQLHVQSLLT